MGRSKEKNQEMTEGKEERRKKKEEIKDGGKEEL